MPHLTLTNAQGQALREPTEGTQAEDLLWAAGVQCGHWAPRIHAVSSLPQLTYARELLALQRRYATAVVQRCRSAPRAHGSTAAADSLHVHDDVELQVVLQGVLRLRLPAPTLGAWLDVALHPCEWLALPAGLPHQDQPDTTHGADLLCLHRRRGGTRTRASAGTSTSTGRTPQAELHFPHVLMHKPSWPAHACLPSIEP